jgi:ketosteroid isomerase-like protein
MKYVYACSLCLLWLACKPKAEQPEDPAAAKVALIEADKQFSSLCVEQGMKAAFIEYLDSNGVLLRPNHFPIVGADAVDFIIQQDESAYQLSWQPRFADVARSGELGYTYGVYTLQQKQTDSVVYGTYVSIWKKQQDGKWKYVLDAGNEGVGEE